MAAVHKAIDSRLIRPKAARTGGSVRRLLTKEQLIYLQLEAEGVRLLPVGARREIADSIRRSPKVDLMAIGNGTVLLVEFKAARRKVEGQLKQLAHIEEMVVSDPEIMRGTPVYRGTRIPVDLVADMLAQGATAEEILDGLSKLEQGKDRHRADVYACVSTARTPQLPSLAAEKGARQEICVCLK
jgi:uncharacterized protein (DUF433 family)